MEPFWGPAFGNPHSRDHAIGWRAGEAVDAARVGIANAIGGTASEVIFTSGATEANNLAIRGIGGETIASAIEHPSVLAAARNILPVGPDGLLDPGSVTDSLGPETRLLSVALVNHEIGVIQPIADIAGVCRERGVLLHADCAQALGKVPVDVAALGVDLASFSAHKAYGPMGIGALFVRAGLSVSPILSGGGQEMGLRPGTVPLPLAVGFAEAAAIAAQEVAGDRVRISRLRDQLLARLVDGIPGLRINGSLAARVAGNLNVTLPEVDAETMMLEMPDVAISSGSACASGASEPSLVPRALGLGVDAASRSLRICLGRFTTEAEIDRAGAMLVAAWRRLAPDFNRDL